MITLVILSIAAALFTYLMVEAGTSAKEVIEWNRRADSGLKLYHKYGSYYGSTVPVLPNKHFSGRRYLAKFLKKPKEYLNFKNFQKRKKIREYHCYVTN